jgi:hypothetical protein
MAYTYSKLAETTVGAGGTSTITFSNIPQNYTDLVLKMSTRINSAVYFNFHYLRFNGSSVSYSDSRLEAQTTTATSAKNTNISETYWGITTGASATANTFASSEIYIPNYTSSGVKSASAESVSENNSGTNNQWGLELFANLWSNVTAISSITIAPSGGSFVQYSTATLYGIRVEI